jgi:hypothetical protein
MAVAAVSFLKSRRPEMTPPFATPKLNEPLIGRVTASDGAIAFRRLYTWERKDGSVRNENLSRPK